MRNDDDDIIVANEHIFGLSASSNGNRVLCVYAIRQHETPLIRGFGRRFTELLLTELLQFIFHYICLIIPVVFPFFRSSVYVYINIRIQVSRLVS